MKYIGQLLKGTNIKMLKNMEKGILYYGNENKAYEGEWKEDKEHGKRIEYYENGNKEYEGYFKENEKDGKGIEYYENGNKICEGDFKKVKKMEKEYYIIEMEIKYMKEN